MNRRDAAVAGGLMLALAAFLLPLAPIGVDPHHDGVMLKPAMDVLSGQALFRDSFTQYGALTCYFQALALWFSPTLLAIRVLTVAVGVLALLFLYAAWRLILPRPLAAVAGIFFILSIPVYDQDPWNHEYWKLLPWSSDFALLLQAVGFYAIGRVIQSKQSDVWSWVAGAACACVFWCRQPVGITMAGSLLVAWPALHATGWMPDAATRRAIWRRLLGGFLLAHGLFLAGLAINGALGDWWYQNFIWPARWSQSVKWLNTLPLFVPPAAIMGVIGLGCALLLPMLLKRRWPALSRRFVAGYFLLLGGFVVWQHAWVMRVLSVQEGAWSGLIPLVLGVQAFISIRLAFAKEGASRDEHYYLVSVWTAVALASLAQYYPMADSWHIFRSLAPGVGIFVFLIWRWSGWPAGRLATVCLLVLLPSAYFKAKAIGPALDRPLVTVTEPAVLRGMRVPAEQALFFKQVGTTLALAEAIQPGFRTVMIGDDALYLCIPRNKENAVPYYVTWAALAPEGVSARRWAYIGEHRPVLILQKARWESVEEFYQRANYVPVYYSQTENLEIAMPREMAAAANLKTYGIFGYGRARHKVAP